MNILCLFTKILPLKEPVLNIDKKYQLYEKSVQNPSGDVDFINEKFKQIKGRKPYSVREDFGGTGFLCCEWVKQGPKYSAHVVDLDPEPINYGKIRHWGKLNKSQQEQVIYHEKNVLEVSSIKADVVVAFNFSYFIFKKRSQLLDYFKEARKAVGKDGVFFLDLFGGSECYSPLEEETEYKNYSYYWDLHSFNPINNHVMYYIHFKEKGKSKKKKAFVYDWRMWSLPELRDLLIDAGFKHTLVYWEGDDDDGGGDGNFEPTEHVEQCDSWVVYLAAYN